MSPSRPFPLHLCMLVSTCSIWGWMHFIQWKHVDLLLAFNYQYVLDAVSRKMAHKNVRILNSGTHGYFTSQGKRVRTLRWWWSWTTSGEGGQHPYKVHTRGRQSLRVQEMERHRAVDRVDGGGAVGQGGGISGSWKRQEMGLPGVPGRNQPCPWLGLVKWNPGRTSDLQSVLKNGLDNTRVLVGCLQYPGKPAESSASQAQRRCRSSLKCSWLGVLNMASWLEIWASVINSSSSPKSVLSSTNDPSIHASSIQASSTHSSSIPPSIIHPPTCPSFCLLIHSFNNNVLNIYCVLTLAMNRDGGQIHSREKFLGKWPGRSQDKVNG